MKVGLVLTALALLPLAPPAMAGNQVPYKGKEMGVITLVAVQLPFIHRRSVAEGEATQVGHYTITTDIVVDARVGTATSVVTFTAANGDMLFLDSDGHVDPTDLTKTVANYTVTGGTGHFEGATGSFTGHQQLAFPASVTYPNPYVSEIEGSISTPGANKQ